MPFVDADNSHTWNVVDGRVACPEIVEIRSTDVTYINMDFNQVLEGQVGISTIAAAPIEKNGKTITIAEESVDDKKGVISFKVSGASAGDFVLVVTPTLTTGTGHTVSAEGTLRVV